MESALRNDPPGSAPWFPESEADRAAIREQLDRLLSSHLFANSKRYPGLLKHIVEETLAGRASLLKERTLGVEVFGREPGYDTNLDPVVRTSAAQVRQRAAQYYLEGGRQSEIRIELHPGSYIPIFHNPLVTASVTPSVTPRPPVAVPEKTRRVSLCIVLAIAAVLGTALVIALFAVHALQADPVAQFWGPVWSAKRVTICVPGRFPTQEDPSQTAGVLTTTPFAAGQPLTILDSQRLNSIAWPDATSLFTLVGSIQSHGQRYVVRRERDTALSDLQGGPTILIGAFNNRWMLRLNSHYRFTWEQNHETGDCWIADSRNSANRAWRVNIRSPYAKFDEDYGIVSRVWDSSTEGWVVSASGIAAYGTISAGELLTNPSYLALIANAAPSGWTRKNIQVVFSTKVFNGNAAPPRILAVHAW